VRVDSSWSGRGGEKMESGEETEFTLLSPPCGESPPPARSAALGSPPRHHTCVNTKLAWQPRPNRNTAGMADAFTARFGRELRGLTLNSRPLIASLTMLAADGAGVAAVGVVDAVGRHVKTV